MKAIIGVLLLTAVIWSAANIYAMTVNPDKSINLSDREAKVLMKKIETLKKENEDQFFYILDLEHSLRVCNSKVEI